MSLEFNGRANIAPRPMSPDTAEPAHDRLLKAATALFAARGYAATSSRDLCAAANVNIASIAYHFGGKADLYRAVFRAMGPQPELLIQAYADPSLSMLDALRAFYGNMLWPFVTAGDDQNRRRLHFRELVEPSGVLTAEDMTWIAPFHQALEGMLCRHVGLNHADADIRLLAHVVVGAGMHLCVAQRMVDALSPGMLQDEASVMRTADRLAHFASAMVLAEQHRRTDG